MIVKKAELVAVASKMHQYPPEGKKEIALAGRSNVGKSSLINQLLNRKIARTSRSPGKTRTINFYEINDAFRIVDLPGYGYAKVSKSISCGWGNMIEAYLENRSDLVKVIQLLDVRHTPTAQDLQMYEWIKHFRMDGLVVATKADKIPKGRLNERINSFRKELGLNDEDLIIPISSLKKTGFKELAAELMRLMEG